MKHPKLSRTQNTEDSCPIDPFAKRVEFVLALRRSYPAFWPSLNQVWREDLDRLGDWLRQRNVVDQWLIDIVHQTIKAWTRDPSGPNATLQPDHPWYCLFSSAEPQALINSKVPDSEPVLDDPYPLWKGPDTGLIADAISKASGSELPELLQSFRNDEWIEPIDDFQKRMTNQFREQLTEYCKQVRSAYGFKWNPQTESHAEWTAVAFAGVSYARISEYYLAGAPHQDPASTVRKAVIRFADEIGLTLPGAAAQGL